MKLWMMGLILVATVAGSYAQQRGEGRSERFSSGDRTQSRKEQMRERMGRMHRPGGSEDDQQPGGPLMHALSNPRARERLGITEEQGTALQERMEALNSQIKALSTRRHDLARQQVELLAKPETTKNDILVVVDQLADIQKQVAKLRIEQLFAVRDIVGAEKMAELRTRMRSRPEGKRGPRRGERRKRVEEEDPSGSPPPPADMTPEDL